MNKRKVLVGPFQFGALNALNDVVNLPPILEHFPKMDVENLFFSCMIQSGVEEFEISQDCPVKESKFLSERISFTPQKAYIKSHEIIRKIFTHHLPDNYERDETYSIIWRLESFLSDLFLSLERRTSMVCILPIPDLARADRLIPPELFYSFQNLLNAFDSENATLPLPRSSISSKNVKIFQGIIASDLFSQYTLTHKELDHNKLPEKKAILDITKAGRALFRNYKRPLYLKNLTISLLPVTAKMIDIIFGRLPGILSEYAVNRLNNWLKNDRRIVLYHFGPMFHEISSRRLTSPSLQE